MLFKAAKMYFNNTRALQFHVEKQRSFTLKNSLEI